MKSDTQVDKLFMFEFVLIRKPENSLVFGLKNAHKHIVKNTESESLSIIDTAPNQSR